MSSVAKTTILLLLLASSLHAQQRDREWDAWRSAGERSEREWDSVNRAIGTTAFPTNNFSTTRTQQLQSGASADSCRVDRIVYGWHPYWGGTAYNGYDYRLLSDVCYFGYDVNPATGGYTSIHNWRTTELVERAHAAGTRVHLCAILFSNHAQFFNSAASQTRLIDSLLSLVAERDADGVNIDFEAVPGSQRAKLTAFMIELARRFHTERPGSQISMALPAVDWSNSFDVAAMAEHVDLFIIMGYDYHWANAETAGPVAPRNNGTLWSALDLSRSTATYLSRGVPRDRLVLALPWYGYDWPVADTTPGAATLGSGSSVTYVNAQARAASYGRRWEPQSSTPWYLYRADSVWRQAWYDDEVSFGLKSDIAVMRDLAGIGIWALGYDGGRPELWGAIADRFTPCGELPCSGNTFDMGGPGGNYASSDTLHYTIAPENADEVRLVFHSFSIADDVLEIFDGRDTQAPLIGSYTGQNSPGTATATSGALTLRFRSDADSVSWGWTADWSCTILPSSVHDIVPPPAPRRRERARDSGIDTSASPFSLTAYPNPTTGTLTIGFRLKSAGVVEIEIIDASGRRVATALNERRRKGENSVEISPAALGLPPGTYVARMRSGEDVESVAVVTHP